MSRRPPARPLRPRAARIAIDGNLGRRRFAFPPNGTITNCEEDSRASARSPLGWIALVTLFIGVLGLTAQITTKTIFAQVEAETQIAQIGLSSGSPIVWALPGNAQLLDCGFGAVMPTGLSEDDAISLRPGARVSVERRGPHAYLKVLSSIAPDSVVLIAGEGKSIVMQEGACLRVPLPSAESAQLWQLRGELILGEELTDAREQRLLISGEVHLYQALGSRFPEWVPGALGMYAMPKWFRGNQFLSESRQLNPGERVFFVDGEGAKSGAEMRGFMQIDEATQGVRISAFGEVDSVVNRRPFRGAESADYLMRGDFVKLVAALFRDATQSALVLVTLLGWFLVDRTWLNK